MRLREEVLGWGLLPACLLGLRSYGFSIRNCKLNRSCLKGCCGFRRTFLGLAVLLVGVTLG
jgi:hypothetical protein